MKNKIRNIFFATLLLNLVVLVGYGYILLDMFETREAVGGLIVEIDSRIEQERELQETIDSFSRLQESFLLINSYFLGTTTREGVEFVSSLEVLANTVGVSDFSIKLTDEIKKDGSKTLQVDANFTGTWSEVWKMLNVVENLNFYTEIQEFTPRIVPDISNAWRTNMKFFVFLR